MQFRLVLSALLLAPIAHGQAQAQAFEGSASRTASLTEQLNELKRQLAEQQQLIESLAREVATQGATQHATQGAAQQAAHAASAPDSTDRSQARRLALPDPLSQDELGRQRGTGPDQASAATAQEGTAQTAHNPAAPSGPAAAPTRPAASTTGPATARRPLVSQLALPANPARPAGASKGQQTSPVGRPPQRNSRPPEVAPLFEQPGVLTPKGGLVLEPSLQYGYSSSNRVALVGYTVIPALLIGLVDVREMKRNTTTASLSLRLGVSNRVEVEARLPYVYRSDATVSREIFTGTAVERVFDTSGRAVGDAEIGLRYQINSGGADRPYYLTGLRIKSRTGRDPFDVITDCTRRCIGPNATGTGLPLTLPTGSGFYGVQPSVTVLFPSDPAVFFGSVSYLHNLKRSNVSRKVLGGESEFLGEIEPGGIAGFNIGMGLGLNDKASFSIGYDHNSVGRTRQNGVPVPGSVRTQLGTLVLGYSYRLSDKRSVSVAIGAGLTRDTPDVGLTLRMPVSW